MMARRITSAAFEKRNVWHISFSVGCATTGLLLTSRLAGGHTLVYLACIVLYYKQVIRP